MPRSVSNRELRKALRFRVINTSGEIRILNKIIEDLENENETLSFFIYLLVFALAGAGIAIILLL